MAEDKEEQSAAKLLVRGCISNSGAAAVLFCIGRGLGLWRFVAVAAGMQLAVFLAHGLPKRSEKFYDLSGSFTHLAVVAAALMSETKVRSGRQMFAALASVVWLTRLGTFLYSRILRDGKDGRFDALKPVALAFMGAWSVQAVWVTVIQLPVILLNDRADMAAVNPLDFLAMVAWLAGFLIEAAADSQKTAFRDCPDNKGKYITTGLWKYSRHPNYFGEILMWASLATLSSSAAFRLGDPSMHFAWLSPAFTTLLLLKVSGVPMVEKAGLKKWGSDPKYMHYMKHTSMLILGPPAPEFSDKSK